MSTCPRPTTFTTVLLSTACVAIALSACGGGGDGGSTAPPPAPTPAPPAPTPAPPAPSPAPPSEPSPPPQAPPPQTPGGQTADCGLPNFSSEMLRLVNEHRTRGAVCGTESLPAVTALTWNAALAQAAARHADDMAQRSFFSHTGSDGTNAGQRITAAGYAWRAWGENIAYGQTSIAIVVTGWMGSEGHCRNIMSSSFAEIGAACVRTDNQQYRLFWVQNFGRR